MAAGSVRRGAQAEQQVCDALRAEGWTLVARNWRGGGGELDVVALRDGVLRVVEVKARARADGSALQSVSRAKQRRLTAAAEALLAERRELDAAARELMFSVALVEAGQLRWLDDAFDAAY